MAELLLTHCGECVVKNAFLAADQFLLVLRAMGVLRRWPAPLRCRAGDGVLQGLLRLRRTFRRHACQRVRPVALRVPAGRRGLRGPRAD